MFRLRPKCKEENKYCFYLIGSKLEVELNISDHTELICNVVSVNVNLRIESMKSIHNIDVEKR